MKCIKEAFTKYDRKKMNTKENQEFSLLLIEHIFSKKKLKSKKRNEKGAYGLSPG